MLRKSQTLYGLIAFLVVFSAQFVSSEETTDGITLQSVAIQPNTQILDIDRTDTPSEDQGSYSLGFRGIPADTNWADGYYAPFYNYWHVLDFYPTDSMLWIAGSGSVTGFDGTSFIDLAPDFYGLMKQFQDYGGDLYVCGNADVIGSAAWGKAICRWNGSGWDLMGEVGGNLEWANAMTVWDGKLIVGGKFSEVGGVSANNIAAWDGSTWTAIGSGVNGEVNALASYSGELIVGGEFTNAGGSLATQLAKWDGSTWSNVVGFALNENIHALKVHGSDLWIGGETYSPVSSWDGSTYSTHGVDPSGQCLGFAEYGGDLVAYGSFSVPGGKIARFDGSSWHNFGAGTDQAVFAGAEWNGDFIAGGWIISRFGSIYSHKIGKWNGSSWEQFGALGGKGMSGGGASAFYDYNGQILVGGGFKFVGTHYSQGIATFEGDSLAPFDQGVCCVVNSILEYDSQLLAAGEMSSYGYIAYWDGLDWVTFGHSLSGPVEDMVIWNGNLVVGGWFTQINGMTVNYIAMWDGSVWSALGTGTNNRVEALAVHDGNLYAGGRFTSASGVPADYVAMFDGVDWFPLSGGVNGWVHDLESYGGDLYIGGSFSLADGVPATGVVRWDGSSFHALDGNFISGGVYCFSSHNTELLIGGEFYYNEPDTSWGIAVWNGTSVQTLGSGVQGRVEALHSTGSAILVGGGSIAGGKQSDGFALWGNYIIAMAGDFDGNGSIDISDLTGTVDWMFGGAPAPADMNTADVDANCTADITDLTYRVDYMFGGGPALLYGCVE